MRVPQLVGLIGRCRAREALAAAKLKLNVDQQTPSDMIPKDTVISQATSRRQPTPISARRSA